MLERGEDLAALLTAEQGKPLAESRVFVRVMLLPASYAGQRTIRYVDSADADKPKTQRATIFVEEPVRP